MSKEEKPDIELKSDQAYQARGIVTGVETIGFIDGVRPVFKYLTMDCGPDRPGICVQFVREADTVTTEAGKFLDTSKLKPKDILVAPGLIYRQIPWTTPLINVHLQALKKYRRKDIITSEKADAPAIDIGTIDPLNLTKQ